MIPFSKEPLIESSVCKGCTNGVFKPIRMTRQVYDNVMKFPMPMPIIKQVEVRDKSSDLHYLSFADAQVLPFTNKFQPSLEATTLSVAAKKKKTVASTYLGASRCAWAPNIEKLKNRNCFKMGDAKMLQESVELWGETIV